MAMTGYEQSASAKIESIGGAILWVSSSTLEQIWKSNVYKPHRW